jgi:protein-L-isoaspartate(D-aspartate) O-methyltransferase
MPDYAVQRRIMVESQILANGITEPALLAAMSAVPRERFVRADRRAIAYADAPIELDRGGWLLEPRTFAKMLQLAEIDASDRVLDVGCGTGYSTAVLSRLGKLAIGLERDADLAGGGGQTLRELGLSNASIVHGPLAEGLRALAPYDVIVIEGGIEQEPRALLAQLAEGGRLVVIARQGGQSHAVLYTREQGQLGRRAGFDATAPVLDDFRQSPGFIF